MTEKALFQDAPESDLASLDFSLGPRYTDAHLQEMQRTRNATGQYKRLPAACPLPRVAPSGLPPVAIVLTKGQTTWVSAEDVPLWFALWCGSQKYGGKYYAAAHVPGGTRTHRQQIMMTKVLLPDARSVDHINGDSLLNTRENIRPATSAQNAANRRKPKRLNSTSRFKGVTRIWKNKNIPWEASIMVNGKKKHLGRFANEVDAAEQYDIAAKEAWGDYARLNFP